MQEQTYDLLQKTKIRDDINMLVNAIMQLVDVSGDDSVAVSVPDATRHCKYWQEVSPQSLAVVMAKKYSDAERLEIPDEYLTSF